MKLHITTTQQIIGRHRNMRHVSVVAAQAEVERLALGPVDAIDARIVDNLERATGLSIGTLAEVARTQWCPVVPGLDDSDDIDLRQSKLYRSEPPIKP